MENRRSFLKNVARLGVLTGLIGLCAVLASREEVFECNDLCGQCSRFKNGKCRLGIQ